jgi:hypothetical protein
MAGNKDVVRRLHEHLQDSLRFHSTVGATHWDAGGANEDLPGPKPEFFFAPGQIGKRSKDWGADKLMALLGESWAGFRDGSKGWLEVRRHTGTEALAEIYAETLGGKASPSSGNVMSLWAGD